jgi:hypothetical protein
MSFNTTDEPEGGYSTLADYSFLIRPASGGPTTSLVIAGNRERCCSGVEAPIGLSGSGVRASVLAKSCPVSLVSSDPDVEQHLQRSVGEQ